MTEQARFSELDDWLAWLETLHPREIDLGLDRIREVAQRLGVLTPKATVLTVGGTNGKGSCIATLNAFLLDGQHSVGTYTSPHIARYNERIRINGHPASSESICRAFAAIDAAREDISLTYFEFGTLAALWLFEEAGLEYWCLEVGLGGRLDAVNIVEPSVSIVTSIALDHEQWLGDTRELIAVEKLGIARPGGVLISSEPDLPKLAADTLAELACTSYFLNEQFSLSQDGEATSITLHRDTPITFRISASDIHLPETSVACAVQALSVVGLQPSQEVFERVVRQLHLAGRFERLWHNEVSIILDVAHNPAALARMASSLARKGIRRVAVVVAMMSDKKISSALTHIAPVVEHWFCAQINDMPRSAKSEDLANIVAQLGVPAKQISACASVAEALQDALDLAHADAPLGAATEKSGGTIDAETPVPASSLEPSTNDAQRDLHVLVVGSFFTVADAHRYLSQHRL